MMKYAQLLIVLALSASVIGCKKKKDTPDMKPVIYLYPEQEQIVRVQLDFAGRLVTTYPKYDESIGGWEVMARLTDSTVSRKRLAKSGSIPAPSTTRARGGTPLLVK